MSNYQKAAKILDDAARRAIASATEEFAIIGDMRLNLYKIEQQHNCDYDTYDSAIVAARSADDARMISPGDMSSWCLPQYVGVTFIGVADICVGEGVVLASFNAG